MIKYDHTFLFIFALSKLPHFCYNTSMKYRELLRTTYFAGFLFSVQVALTAYINSSYLATKLPDFLIGILYTASAALAIAGLFLIPKLISAFGSSKIIGFLMLANILNILGMILSSNVYLVSFCFVLYFAFTTLIYLGIDIIIEHWSANTIQGTVRGAYLTSMNIGYMIGPIVAGFIADRLGFGVVYGFAIVFLIPVFIMIGFQLPTVTHIHESKANILGLARKFITHPELGSVFTVNFILQFFYAWMVIYTPIYLHQYAHIAWDTIGIMFTVMLLAFPLFEYPLGKLADKFKIEKSFMILGLITMGVATFFVTKAPVISIGALIAVLFITRIGASTVEVMTESYFFRKVDHNDTGSIGFFRNTLPFAYILAPVIASVVLKIAPMWTLFTILGVICCAGILVIFPRKRKVGHA